MSQELDRLKAENQKLREKVAELEAEGCPVHRGEIHGGEAEELRKGIEHFLANPDDYEMSDELERELRVLIDDVDARDSLGHLEYIDKLNGESKRYQDIISEQAQYMSKRLSEERWVGWSAALSCIAKAHEVPDEERRHVVTAALNGVRTLMEGYRHRSLCDREFAAKSEEESDATE